MPHDYEFVTSETQQYKGLGDVNKIWGNVTPPNDKTRTILATMHKGVAANGMAIVLSLFEV